MLLQKLEKVFYTEGGVLYKLEQYKILFSIILVNMINLKLIIKIN